MVLITENQIKSNLFNNGYFNTQALGLIKVLVKDQLVKYFFLLQSHSCQLEWEW